MTFNEWLTYLTENGVGPIQMAKQLYDKDRLIQRLNEEISDLKEELEESRACEDPALRGERNFRNAITSIFMDREVRHNIAKARVEREHKEGISLDEMDIKEA